jgi:hypothetical protein
MVKVVVASALALAAAVAVAVAVAPLTVVGPKGACADSGIPPPALAFNLRLECRHLWGPKVRAEQGMLVARAPPHALSEAW